jgi:hypothetical protein
VFVPSCTANTSPKTEIPTFGIFFCIRTLGRNAKAANTYVRWLHASVNPERRPEVLEVLGKLDHLVARFRIEVSEPDATVTVDGQTIDSEMLATLRLESGSHRVVATKKGFRSTSAMISGDAGETIPVHLVLEKLPSETDPGFSQPATTPHHISTDRHRVRKGGGLRVAGLASAVVGALALGAGVYFGLEANSLDGELADAGTRLSRDDQPWTGDLLAKQGDAETAETLFFALTIAGGGAIIGGSVLYALGYLRGRRDSLAVTPTASVGRAGLTISGAF